VRRGQDPAARVGDRRGQRPLVRVDPDHVARMIGRHQQMRRSRTALHRSLHWRTSTGVYVVGGSADNIPVDALHGANAPIRSGRSSKARTEADTSSERHPSPGVRSLWSQTSVQPPTLGEPSPARAPRFNTGIALISDCMGPHQPVGDERGASALAHGPALCHDLNRSGYAAAPSPSPRSDAPPECDARRRTPDALHRQRLDSERRRLVPPFGEQDGRARPSPCRPYGGALVKG
jgi:hypothetical protein